MTIPSTPRKAGPYTGTGVQTTWPFTFKVFAETDLEVTIADTLGVETVLSLGQYTVTLNPNQETSPGGTVTYALPNGSKLTVTGNLPYDQPLDLPSGGNFSPLALENELDRLTMQVQQLREQVGRAIQVSVTTGADVGLPAPSANALIGWDTDAQTLQNFPLESLATAVSFATYRFNTFTGDGVTTQFVLEADPATLGNMDVAVDGVTFTPGVDYTLVAGVCVFTAPPSNGAEILVRYGQGLPSGVTDANDVSYLPAGTGAVATNVQTKLRESVSVKDFGADGTALTAAFAAMPATNGVLEIPGGVVVDLGGTDVAFPSGKTKFHITGAGRIKNGAIVFDNLGEVDGRISNVNFRNDTWVAGVTSNTFAIKISRTRRLNISSCSFDQLDQPVYLAPHPSATFHSTAMINVVNCTFNEVNFAYTQLQDAGIPVSTFTVNDVSFTNNVINNCYKSHVHFHCIDGINISNNVCFMSGSNATKEYNVRITALNDQVMITNNQFFESGLDAIRLTDAKRCVITGNNIIWAGSKAPASGVKIDGAQLTEAVINGNNISGFSEHGVDVLGTNAVSVLVTGNNLKYGNAVYYGATDLNTIPHYAVKQTNNVISLRYHGNTTNVDYLVGPAGAGERFAQNEDGSGVAAIRRTVSVTGANTPIIRLGSAKYTSQTAYSGLVMVQAKTSSGSWTTNNAASYLLFVTKAQTNSACAVVSSAGLTAGSSATWPSFTWSIDTTNNELEATPVGSTTGGFTFSMTAIGDLSFVNLP
jgi:hypothetical protein